MLERIREAMRERFRGLVRMVGFFRKELVQIVRQPRLLLMLVLGPFVILLIFGLGFRNEAATYRMLFVTQPGSALDGQIEEYAANLHPQLVYMGVVHDEQEALSALRNNSVDLVAVAPPDAYDKIRNSERAVFRMYTDEIDPVQVDWLSFFGGVFVNQANKRVLLDVTQAGQRDASALQEDVRAARDTARDTRLALVAGNAVEARVRQRDLNRRLGSIAGGTAATLGLLESVESNVGPGSSEGPSAVAALLDSIDERNEAIGDIDENSSSYDEEISELEGMEEDLAALDEQLQEFNSVAPEVLIEPFGVETESVAASRPDVPTYLSPAAIALLLQHMAVTVAGLSMVRERQVGAFELFRVGPVTAAETLLGKYLSYFVLQGLLAAALTALMIYLLNVPMLGHWDHYALVLAVVTFTSLGIGFVISLVSQTDSQAVQYTMFVLLTSVFFSGFFMSLEMLIPAVRVVSWSMPTTYGIVLLRDIMLRGRPYDPLLLGGLAAIGVLMCLIAWLMLNRQLRRG